MWRRGCAILAELERRRALAGPVERKLITIMCADVSGYSRLMEADESGTLATLKLYRDAMVGLEHPVRYRGRLVGISGDSLLLTSKASSKRCNARSRSSASWPSSYPARAGRAPDEFRIGINLGDVMVEGGDLYGEGVNVAARLEALASRVASASRAPSTIRPMPATRASCPKRSRSSACPARRSGRRAPAGVRSQR